jgi:hypothetical protein
MKNSIFTFLTAGLLMAAMSSCQDCKDCQATSTFNFKVEYYHKDTITNLYVLDSTRFQVDTVMAGDFIASEETSGLLTIVPRPGSNPSGIAEFCGSDLEDVDGKSNAYHESAGDSTMGLQVYDWTVEHECK